MATYFVKTGGSDSASGLSDVLAWATVSKVNGFTFAAGDVVQFNRGNIWREFLQFPTAGSAGNVITITNYGVGSLPVITAADILSTSGWTLAGGTSATYNKALTQDPGLYVLENGVVLTKASSIANADTIPGSFFWATNVISIRASDGSNPASNGKNYETPIRFAALDPQPYNTAIGLDLEFGTGFPVNMDGANNFTIQSCIVRYAGNGGNQALWVGDSPKTNNQTIIGNDISFAGTCLYMNGDNIVVSNNVFHGAINGIEMRDITASHCQNFLVQGNVFKNMGNATAVNSGILLDGDTHGTNSDFHQGTLQYNYFNTIQGRAIDGFFGNSLVQYNIIANVTVASAGSDNAIEVNGPNNRIYGNTIANCTNIGIFVNTNPVAGNVANDIRNNLLYMPTCNHIIAIATGVTTPTLSNNLYWPGSAGAVKYSWHGTDSNFTTWKSSSGETAASLESDPLFNNAVSDFSLQATSPAIRVGTNLGTPYNIGFDNRVLQTGLVVAMLDQNIYPINWTIGAFVFFNPTISSVYMAGRYGAK